MSDPYVYPGTSVLINRYDIRDTATLDRVERLLVAQRLREGAPRGDFDQAHIQAIHRHLFQDIYPWAGELRTVSLQRGESVFLPPDRIPTGLGDIHRRLVDRDFLTGMTPADFSTNAAEIIGDLNYAHPFREGNGRTQMQVLDQLAEEAGHALDLTRTDRETWYAASIAAQDADYGPMQDAIHEMIDGPDQQQTPEQDRPSGEPEQDH